MEELTTTHQNLNNDQKVTKFNLLLMNQSIKSILLSQKKVFNSIILSNKVKEKENTSDLFIKFY